MAAIMEAYSPDCITLRGNGPIPEALHLGTHINVSLAPVEA